MPDEFDTINLDWEGAQEIINWAVSAGAMAYLMEGIPEMIEDERERVEHYSEGVAIMLSNMPFALAQQSKNLAADSLGGAIEEEVAVEELREDLKDL